MLVVGDNLQELCRQHGLVDNENAFDVTSIKLTLHATATKFKTEALIDYGKPLKPDWYDEFEIPDEGIEINKKNAYLCCSEEKISIPSGYFGFVQTKGSLARLFVSVTCNDGQIDPGYSGRITFEIVNLGHLRIRLPPKSEIAQLFIFRTSTNNVPPYAGRYQNADKPTVYRPR